MNGTCSSGCERWHPLGISITPTNLTGLNSHREHVAVLVDEDSPVFSAGLIELTVTDVLMAPRVMAAFHDGRGIPYSNYPSETFDGIERLTKPDYRHRLTQTWLPSVPGVVERLRIRRQRGGPWFRSRTCLRRNRSRIPKIADLRFRAICTSRCARQRECTGRGCQRARPIRNLRRRSRSRRPIRPDHDQPFAASCRGSHQPVRGSTRQAVAPNGALLIVEERGVVLGSMRISIRRARATTRSVCSNVCLLHLRKADRATAPA